ncbi:MAG: Gfo/Idh/MocA family oxidoreductase [Candidatus Nanopelagicales bacterium]|nr:Gfo/Idh/MocA family oxidoreductase [Candidatus Nanopelagicales bacterium]
MIRVGIIGCGRISDLHAAAYHHFKHASITAIADPVAANLTERGDAWGVPPTARHSDAGDLLARDDVDMVEILVPHHLHEQIAGQAAAAGKHISLQKPMAMDVAQADRIIASATAAGVTLKVFENFVFYPPIQRARDLIDNGEIGDVLSIRLKSAAGYSTEGWQVPAEAMAWRFDMVKSGGGPQVFDDGHHKFSSAWYLHGFPKTLHAFIGSSFNGVLDSPSVVTWQYEDGAVGSFEATFSPELRLHGKYYGQDDRIEITGTKGVIWVTRGHGRMTDEAPVILYKDQRTIHMDDMDADWGVSFVKSGRHFVHALLEGTDPVITGEQGRDLLAFSLAAQRSAAEGVRVEVAPGPPPPATA